VVVDNELASGTDTVRLVFNQPPSADAGDDQQVGYSSVVILDGTQSSDTNGEVDGFLWEQLSGDPVSVFSADQAIATFYSPNIETALSFVLLVFDEQGLSDKDTVNIFISSLSINTGGKEKDRISLFPNPFNSMLFINYFSQSGFKTREVTVYNIIGEKIINWDISSKNSENSFIYWGAKDERGFEIRSGLYFVRLESDNSSIIKKVTYLK